MIRPGSALRIHRTSFPSHRQRVGSFGRCRVEIVSVRKVRLADQFYRRSHTSWGQRLGGRRLIQRHLTILARTTTVVFIVHRHHHHNQSSQELQIILRGLTEVRVFLE